VSVREQEFEARPLGDGWIEVRMVYQTGPKDDRHPHHARGEEAMRDCAHFIITFAQSMAAFYGAPALANALGRLWKHIHDHSGCDCGQTRH